MMSVNNNMRVLITGATSGIGRFLTGHFVNRGDEVFIHGRSQEKLDELERTFGASKVMPLLADFRRPDEIAGMFRKISETGGLNCLINNAFGKLEDKIVDASGDALREFFDVSIAGTADVVRSAVPLLQGSSPSHIMNIVADWGFPMHNIMTGPALYIAAKYGVHGLGVALQTEIASLGIKTSNICPGIVAADSPFVPGGSAPADWEGTSIHPCEIANAVDFILNSKSAHIRSIVLSPNNPDYNGL
ncbi:MAG: SDR family NAD(P)-dependent oxidoreductase [Acidobacteria bacterium]|nr:SDR family NAD(P)-dependent oxidoreductase [Acidobacteriota bacterium]